MPAKWGEFHLWVRLLALRDGSQSWLQVPAVLVCLPGAALPGAFMLLELFVSPQLGSALCM